MKLNLKRREKKNRGTNYKQQMKKKTTKIPPKQINYKQDIPKNKQRISKN